MQWCYWHGRKRKMIKPIGKNDRRKKIMPQSADLKQKCEDLRYIVEHPNREGLIMSQTGVTVQRDPKLVMTIKCDGVEVGYRVVPSSPLEINPYFDRDVFIRIPGYKFSDLSVEEREKFFSTIFEVFIEAQMEQPKIEPLSEESVKISQHFMVAFPMRVPEGKKITKEQRI
jgi:hypothetical protein